MLTKSPIKAHAQTHVYTHTCVGTHKHTLGLIFPSRYWLIFLNPSNKTSQYSYYLCFLSSCFVFSCRALYGQQKAQILNVQFDEFLYVKCTHTHVTTTLVGMQRVPCASLWPLYQDTVSSFPSPQINSSCPGPRTHGMTPQVQPFCIWLLLLSRMFLTFVLVGECVSS